MNTYVIVIGVIVAYNLVVNLYRWKRVEHFYDLHQKWFNNPTWDLVQYKHEVIELFKKAGVKDASMSVVQPAGYGQIMTGTASVFSNFPSQRADAATMTVGFFNQAIGVYRRRTINSLNPFSWIDRLLHFPSIVFAYFGSSTEKLIFKLFQVIYWFLGAIFAILTTIYPEETKAFIKTLPIGLQ